MVLRRHLIWLVLVGSLALPASAVWAEDGDGDGDGDDQTRARDAVTNEHSATLKEILAIVHQQYDGDVVQVTLTGSGENLTYRIKLLDRDNHLIEVRVNAKSRLIISVKGT
jgi:uncharacterized membrane protein YkoI